MYMAKFPFFLRAQNEFRISVFSSILFCFALFYFSVGNFHVTGYGFIVYKASVEKKKKFTEKMTPKKSPPRKLNRKNKRILNLEQRQARGLAQNSIFFSSLN